MASPFNYTISSIIVNDLDNTDNESEVDGNDIVDLDDGNDIVDVVDFDDGNDIVDLVDENDIVDHDDLDEDYSVSGMFPAADMDTSAVDSDLEHDEDVPPEFLEEDFSAVDETEADDTESSTQVESDAEEVDEDAVREPESKRAKLEENEQFDDVETVDPNQKCPICLAAWTNVGEHRLCSLRCGHLFGHKCIKHWLTSTNPSAKKCPQCNSRASVRHVRLIYGNKLTCVDTSQIEKMKKQLEESNVKLSKISKALSKQKRKTKKYKQMYKARTLALTVDSDFGFSD